MKLSEIKEGDIVIRADGAVRMYLNEDFRGDETYPVRGAYDEDLRTSEKAWRIKKIYRCTAATFGNFKLAWFESEFRPGNWSLIYEMKPDIMVDGKIVEFKTDSIKIGCTTVSKETVSEIYRRLNS